MNHHHVRRLFREMLRIRLVEETIADLYAEQEIRCPVHLCIGQEAIAVGVCAALGADDYVLGGHRSHGHYLAKGGNLPAMMAEIYGKATGCCSGKGGSMHLVDLVVGFLAASPIVASTIPIAVGTAFGAVLRNQGRVTVAFFGEGATEEGVFHESVSFAALKRLPIVFVCENNLFSVYSPLEVRQPAGRALFELVRGHGIEALQADGNDVMGVAGRARHAIDKARRGSGPTFLEFTTYRWREHCGPNYDNDLGYRTEAQFLSWQARCPVATLASRLLKEGILTESDRLAMETEIKAEIADAVQFAKNSPFPRPEAAYEDVFAS